MSDNFEYESAREYLWHDGFDPDELSEIPQKRDAFLRKNGIDPDQFKPESFRKGRGRGGSGKNSGGSSSSGTSGCFLTTACVRAKNLPDDCDELETLRAFRDSYMMSTEQRQAEIEYYYEIAPAIVASINDLPNADEIWENIFEQIIVPAVSLIKQNKLDDSYTLYKNCVLLLQTRFISVC